MNKPKLSSILEIQHIRNLLVGKGTTKLNQLSDWHQYDNSWKVWKYFTILVEFQHHWHLLLQQLKGTTPTQLNHQDNFKWNLIGGIYTIKSGYNALQGDKYL